MRYLPNVLLTLFFLIRYPFQTTLYSIHGYATYGFEIIFILLTLGIFRKNRGLFKLPNKKELTVVLLVFGLGMVVRGAMNPLNLFLPWSLVDNIPDTLMLLVGGPILEELLYRQALWILIEKIIKNKWTIIVITSLLFALGHFWAFFEVDEFLKSFVIYQTGYTCLLGLICGGIYSRGKNIFSTILIHAVFNLGFYISNIMFGNI